MRMCDHGQAQGRPISAFLLPDQAMIRPTLQHAPDKREAVSFEKIMILLTVLSLLLSCAAYAEDGMNVEIIRMDGISVIVFVPRGFEVVSRGTTLENPTMKLPASLQVIETEAFAGILAETVEVSANVERIEARAFADCQNLRWITIPSNVTAVDDKALEGCRNVIVYGTTGSEAQRFAEANAANGFIFIDPSAPSSPEKPPIVQESDPVELPFVPVNIS